MTGIRCRNSTPHDFTAFYKRVVLQVTVLTFTSSSSTVHTHVHMCDQCGRAVKALDMCDQCGRAVKALDYGSVGHAPTLVCKWALHTYTIVSPNPGGHRITCYWVPSRNVYVTRRS